MNFKQFITESNSVARTNALKQQQELIDDGHDDVKVRKLPGGVYYLICERYGDQYPFFCKPNGEVIFGVFGEGNLNLLDGVNDTDRYKVHIDVDRLLTSPYQAFRYAYYILEERFPEGEAIIATHAECARAYSVCIIQGPWSPGEAAIAKDDSNAYDYADRALKGPFPAGEQAIAASAKYSYKYACHVIKGPWPAGEQAIATDAEWAYYYALEVLQGPFPAGEKMIAKSGRYAYLYALNVLKGPFPAGERSFKSKRRRAEYEEFLASLKK